jgi:ADP-ribose pyrophosphatase YjhB (NUDIX family)
VAGQRRQVPCVGALIYDDAGRILLVRRANEPARGRWSVPGGRVEPGEDGVQAVVREVAEETGLEVVAGRLVGSVLRDAPDGAQYIVADYACHAVGGVLAAGDDATAVAWFSAADLAALPTSAGLVAALTEWDALPR